MYVICLYFCVLQIDEYSTEVDNLQKSLGEKTNEVGEVYSIAHLMNLGLAIWRKEGL